MTSMKRIAVAFVYVLIATFGLSQALAARPCHDKQVLDNSPIAQSDSIVRSDSDHSEYRYLQFGDFGGFDRKLQDPTGADIDVNMHVIMGGINFHF